MTELLQTTTEALQARDITTTTLITSLTELAQHAGYAVADIDTKKPWGGFVRFTYEDGDAFIGDFFPDIDPIAARLGDASAALSPKFLIVAPNQRLSWQVHKRRAERWRFLTDGGYYRSQNPEDMGELQTATAGDVVQFAAGECHRLVGDLDNPTVVAEIWQHTDPGHPSDEADITRLQDDYKR
jgi:mannose-6-phosphate isomerase-like protein (cupin superfamily)